MTITREQIVAELRTDAVIQEVERLQRRVPTTGTDGEQTCLNCAPLAEREATHRAENQLLVAGPVPAQEAVALVHLVKRAQLARAKGDGTVKLYIPKEAEAANVSKATMTRALNKLRAAKPRRCRSPSPTPGRMASSASGSRCRPRSGTSPGRIGGRSWP